MLWDMLGGTHSSSTCFMRTDTLQASLGTSLLQARPSQASAQQNRVRWWKKEREEERKRKGREARARKLVVNQNWNRGEEATGRVKKKQREVESRSATAEKSWRGGGGWQSELDLLTGCRSAPGGGRCCRARPAGSPWTTTGSGPASSRRPRGQSPAGRWPPPSTSPAAGQRSEVSEARWTVNHSHPTQHKCDFTEE